MLARMQPQDIIAQAERLPGPQRLQVIEQLLNSLTPADTRIRLLLSDLWSLVRQRLEDAIDAEIARQRLAELERDPGQLVTGEELQRELAEIEKRHGG
jgi:cytochrome c-type biogenesis protein CcmH/NrfG